MAFARGSIWPYQHGPVGLDPATGVISGQSYSEAHAHAHASAEAHAASPILKGHIVPNVIAGTAPPLHDLDRYLIQRQPYGSETWPIIPSCSTFSYAPAHHENDAMQASSASWCNREHLPKDKVSPRCIQYSWVILSSRRR